MFTKKEKLFSIDNRPSDAKAFCMSTIDYRLSAISSENYPAIIDSMCTNMTGDLVSIEEVYEIVSEKSWKFHFARYDFKYIYLLKSGDKYYLFDRFRTPTTLEKLRIIPSGSIKDV